MNVSPVGSLLVNLHDTTSDQPEKNGSHEKETNSSAILKRNERPEPIASRASSLNQTCGSRLLAAYCDDHKNPVEPT